MKIKNNPNLCRIIMYIIVMFGLICAGISLITYGTETIHFTFWIFAAVSFAGIIFGVVTVRCPECGRQLSLRGLKTQYCPHCGKKID